MSNFKKLLESNKQKIVAKLKESIGDTSMADEMFDDLASTLTLEFDMREEYETVDGKTIPYYSTGLKDGSALRVDIRVDNSYQKKEDSEDL